MTREASPVGQACNLACTYCYENTMRDAGNTGGQYDVDAMITTLDKVDDPFILFGGEPLLMKVEDLEKMFAFGLRRYKSNGIQTNGTLITDHHIALFKQYSVGVGISIDGLGLMNAPRCGHDKTIESAIDLSNKTMENIIKLVNAEVQVALIITIHKHNASRERMNDFKSWLRLLDGLGIQSARIHLLESHHHESDALSEEDTIWAFLELAKFEVRELVNLRFDKFKEMLSLLSADGEQVSCVWTDCDTYVTDAVQGVNGDGTSSNCGRANKDGINWLKAGSTSKARQLSLYDTPQEQNGCKDCRFFLVCRGYCPGTAVDTDWRNRTEHCGTIKALYTYFEQVLLDNRKVPLSLSPRLKEYEQTFIQGLEQGRTMQTSYENWSIINGKKVIHIPVKR